MDAWTRNSRPRRQRGTWIFAPVALAALVALAGLGCGPITPIGRPAFIGTVADLTFPVDEEIRAQVLPAATGGTGTLTYSLGPEIPGGLAFDPASRTLSGTPTATGNYPVTYRVEDTNGRSAELAFTITIERYSLIRSIVAAIEVAGAAGVSRFEDVPEPGNGPSVAVVGNHFYVAGGSVFLDIEPEPGATVDKLILSIEGESFGYYEIDVPTAGASHRLVGRAFGAYLARNYGGAALFGGIVQSDRSGVGAVEGAVRNQGHDESFLDLLTNWGAATLLSDNTDAPAPYQYNTGTWRTSYTGGLEFRLGSINLYNYIYAPGRLARPGPHLHPLPSFNDRTQPPHSNMYTTLGRQSGTLRLSVTAESENRITVVVKE